MPERYPEEPWVLDLIITLDEEDADRFSSVADMVPRDVITFARGWGSGRRHERNLAAAKQMIKDLDAAEGVHTFTVIGEGTDAGFIVRGVIDGWVTGQWLEGTPEWRRVQAINGDAAARRVREDWAREHPEA